MKIRINTIGQNARKPTVTSKTLSSQGTYEGVFYAFRCHSFLNISNRAFQVAASPAAEHSTTERHVGAITNCFYKTPEDSTRQQPLPQSPAVLVQ